VIARQDKGCRKALATELNDHTSMMFNYLLNKGINVSMDVEERYCSKSTRSMDGIIVSLIMTLYAPLVSNSVKWESNDKMKPSYVLTKIRTIGG
jgi:hypothetical protein